MIKRFSRINNLIGTSKRDYGEVQPTKKESESGSFDGIVGSLISGWLTVAPNSDATVSLMFGAECISKTQANIHRSDLAELGLINGRGYVFSIYEIENQLRRKFEINMDYIGSLTTESADGVKYSANGNPINVRELLCILPLCYASLVFNTDFFTKR